MYPLLAPDIYIKRNPIGGYLYRLNDGHIEVCQINSTACDILELCDSTKTADEIAAVLSKRYFEEFSKARILTERFIEQSVVLGTCVMSDAPQKKVNKVYGDGSFWLPDFAVLHLTNRCLLRCKHCFISAKNGNDGHDMDFRVLETLIDELVDIGVYTIQLTGGEPFLFQELSRVLDKLIVSNINVILATSGSIGSGTHLGVLNHFPKERLQIQVSLDGLETYHNSIRQNKNAFSNTIETIRFLIGSSFVVSVVGTYINQTSNEIEELVKFVRDLGVHSFRLGYIMLSGRAESYYSKDAIRTFHDYKQYIVMLQERYNSQTFRIASEDRYRMLSAESEDIHCGAGAKLVSIASDFTIMPCPSLRLNMGAYSKKGDLTKSLKQWSRFFMEDTPPGGSRCGQCNDKELCNMCYSQAVISSANMKNCRYSLQEIEKRVLSRIDSKVDTNAKN